MAVLGSGTRRNAALSAIAVLLVSSSLVLAAVPASADPPGTITDYGFTGVSGPYEIALGADGAMWFTNNVNNSIGRVDVTTGIISNYADATINGPAGIAAGPDGALWFANTGGNTIGRITTGGVVSSYSDATINGPTGIAAGSDGALWFTNNGGNSIGRMDTTGTVTDNYTDLSIGGPYRIAEGPDGAMWFTNAGNSSIGRIDLSGSPITSFTDAFSSPNGIALGPDSRLWFTASASDTVYAIDTAGVVSPYTDAGNVNLPVGIAAGSDGAVWFVNSGNNSVGRVDTSGSTFVSYTDPSINVPLGIASASGPGAPLVITNLSGNSVSKVSTAGLVTTFGTGIASPSDVTLGPDGALWFTNTGNNSIGRITTGGAISNFTDPTISAPLGITAGSDGALWFTNTGNNSIGRITTAGVVTNHTDASINYPTSIVSAPGVGADLYFTNQSGDTIGQITTAGVVTDHPDVSIDGPTDIASGPDGALWFTNQWNSSIGRITTAGAITGYTPGGLSQPTGITSGPDGNLWFTDSAADQIGKMDTSGTLLGFYADATINDPESIASGSDGALWFTNTGVDSIGRITTAGAVTDYTAPSLANPIGIAAGPDGGLWFGNNLGNTIGRIESGSASGSAPTVPTIPNQTVNEGDLVTIDWTGATSNPLGHPLTSTMVQTAGPAPTYIKTTSATQRKFVAPLPPSASPVALTFDVTVTDTVNLLFTVQTVTITVNNVAPVAAASAPKAAVTGSVVTLVGSSGDPMEPDQAPVGTVGRQYNWIQIAGPSVTLAPGAGPAFRNVTFTPTVVGTYVFSLTVKDHGGTGASSGPSAVALNVRSAPASGTLSGIVTDGTAPLAGVAVDVHTGSPGGPIAGSTVTGGTGAWSVGGLSGSPTKYYVQFSLAGYGPRWNNDGINPAAVRSVTAPNGLVDATLTLNANLRTVSGTALRSNLLPASSVLVKLYDSTGWLDSTTTNGAGAYSFTGLTPKNGYRVQIANADPVYASVWVTYDGVGALSGFSGLTYLQFDTTYGNVVTPTTTVYNKLTETRTLTVTVQDASAAPVTGVDVRLYNPRWITATKTNSTPGVYVLSGLRPSAYYQLWVWTKCGGCTSTSFTSQYYNGIPGEQWDGSAKLDDFLDVTSNQAVTVVLS